MQEYVLNSDRIFTAEQYTKDYLPRGVVMDTIHNSPEGGGTYDAALLQIDGGWVLLEFGDWVVTYSDRTKHRWDDAMFRYLFVPKT